VLWGKLSLLHCETHFSIGIAALVLRLLPYFDGRFYTLLWKVRDLIFVALSIRLLVKSVNGEARVCECE
jgi:hypothetical protein